MWCADGVIWAMVGSFVFGFPGHIPLFCRRGIGQGAKVNQGFKLGTDLMCVYIYEVIGCFDFMNKLGFFYCPVHYKVYKSSVSGRGTLPLFAFGSQMVLDITWTVEPCGFCFFFFSIKPECW